MLSWMLLAVALAVEPTPLVSIDGDRVVALATEAWEAGRRPALTARVDAADRARRSVAVGPTEVVLQTQLGHAAGDQLMGYVRVPLATGASRRAAWEGLGALAKADARADRWAYVAEARATWTHGWHTAALSEHLVSWSEQVAEDLGRYGAAAEQGLVARADVDDLAAELGTVHAERAEVDAELRRTEAALAGLIGQPVRLVADPLEEVTLPPTNPWRDLVDRAASHPLVAADRARARARAADAAALGASAAPVLEVGAMGMQVGTATARSYAPLAIVGLSVPLQPGDRSARRAALGEADAATRDADWTLVRVTADLETRAVAWDADVVRLATLDEQVIAPLAQREARLAEALSQGLVTADRLVRARRDHHEAEHARLAVVAGLLDDLGRAQVLALAMNVELP